MNNIFQDFFTIIWQLIAPLISAFSPLLIGLALAYFLRPAVDWLSPKVGSVKAILLTYFAFFSAAAALTGGFVILILGALPTGNLHDTITLIADYFEEAYSTAADFLNRWLPSKLSAPSHAAEELQSWISRFFSVRSLTSLISSISGIAVSLLLVHFVIRIPVGQVLKNTYPTLVSVAVMTFSGIFLQSRWQSVPGQLLAVILCVLIYAVSMVLLPGGRRQLLEVPVLGAILKKLRIK
jgi:predicted PurR-regulated permease PerM